MSNLSNNGSASDPGFAAAAAAISVAARNDTSPVTDFLHTPTYIHEVCMHEEVTACMCTQRHAYHLLSEGKSRERKRREKSWESMMWLSTQASNSFKHLTLLLYVFTVIVLPWRTRTALTQHTTVHQGTY